MMIIVAGNDIYEGWFTSCTSQKMRDLKSQPAQKIMNFGGSAPMETYFWNKHLRSSSKVSVISALPAP